MDSAKLISISLPEENSHTKLNINSSTSVGEVMQIIHNRPTYVDKDMSQFGIALEDDPTIVFSGETRISKIPSVSNKKT